MSDLPRVIDLPRIEAATEGASAPTLDDVRAWPATVDVSKAATALGCSKSHLYELIKKHEAPVRVLSLGGRQRVVTASLVRLLEGA